MNLKLKALKIRETCLLLHKRGMSIRVMLNACRRELLPVHNRVLIMGHTTCKGKSIWVMLAAMWHSTSESDVDSPAGDRGFDHPLFRKSVEVNEETRSRRRTSIPKGWNFGEEKSLELASFLSSF